LKNEKVLVRLVSYLEPPVAKARDSHIDSLLGFRPRQNAITGLFDHGRTDRDIIVFLFDYLVSILIFFQVQLLYNN
jgi:hypothetical protein